MFRDKRMLGNSRIDPCSRILKRELAAKWLKANAPGATVVVGIDWLEGHRLPPIVARYGAMGHPVEAPLMDLATGRRNRLPAAQLVRRTLKLVEPHARELGSEADDALKQVHRDVIQDQE